MMPGTHIDDIILNQFCGFHGSGAGGALARILLIDDDELVLATIRRALERDGQEVVPAGGGREGLAVFDGETFDLVITDLVMPDGEGIETIRAIRARNADTPIIAISGGGLGRGLDPDTFLRMAAKLGANKVLRKPFTPRELRQVVRDVLPESGSADD